MALANSTMAAMCRPQTSPVFGPDGQVNRAILDHNIDIYCKMIAHAATEYGARLISFPQFGLTGYTPLDSPAWADASVTFPGPDIGKIADAAKAAHAYVVVEVAEQHPAFPGRFFRSAAVLTPAGAVGLVYRKNYSMSTRTSPVDVQDRFVETFGSDAFFPVLETEIGNIGVIIGAEAHWPEATRALALKGAEIIINPIAASPFIDYLKRPGAQEVRRVRAFENVTYFGVPNIEGDGPDSMAYDYDGGSIGTAVENGTILLADFDIEALRRARSAPTANFLAQIQPSIHEPITDLPLWPRNSFPLQGPADFEALASVERQAWQRLQALGRGKAPQD
jgi:predicted amidohydrolase